MRGKRGRGRRGRERRGRGRRGVREMRGKDR